MTLSDTGAIAYRDAHLIDGSEWTADQAAAAGQCRSTRMGRRWEMGCQGQRQTDVLAALGLAVLVAKPTLGQPAKEGE